MWIFLAQIFGKDKGIFVNGKQEQDREIERRVKMFKKISEGE